MSIPVTVSRPQGAGPFPAVVMMHDCSGLGPRSSGAPAKECERLAGGNVTVKVYPGAHHSFDSDRPVRFVAERLNPAAPGGRGATTGGNAAAWKDAIEQVTAFFDRHLKEMR